jgi:hypothetical protein
MYRHGTIVKQINVARNKKIHFSLTLQSLLNRWSRSTRRLRHQSLELLNDRRLDVTLELRLCRFQLKSIRVAADRRDRRLQTLNLNTYLLHGKKMTLVSLSAD